MTRDTCPVVLYLHPPTEFSVVFQGRSTCCIDHVTNKIPNSPQDSSAQACRSSINFGYVALVITVCPVTSSTMWCTVCVGNHHCTVWLPFQGCNNSQWRDGAPSNRHSLCRHAVDISLIYCPTSCCKLCQQPSLVPLASGQVQGEV